MVHGSTELLFTRTNKQHSLELLRRHCLRQQLPTRCHLPYQGKITRASDMGHCVSGRQSNKCDLGPRLHKGDGLTTSHREIHESSGQASPEMRDSTITSYLLICEQRDNPGEGEMQSMVSTTPLCFTDFDIVEQGTVPMLMSFSQMRNLRFERVLTPEQALMTCPAFGYKSFPLKMSISRHLILDLVDMANSATLQGKSRLVSSREGCTFELSIVYGGRSCGQARVRGHGRSCGPVFSRNNTGDRGRAGIRISCRRLSGLCWSTPCSHLREGKSRKGQGRA